MPIDHYKMSIQAKPLYSVLGRADAGSLMKIVRPLGSIRRAKLSNCASNRSEILSKSLDISAESEFLQQDNSSSSPKVDDSESTIDPSADLKEDSTSVKEDQFLPKMQRTKSKVFESRYKIAASRNSEPVKPARLYNKRVVYLPMFRINVETYVGNEEDTRAVENTRQSLKMMIDKGRRQTKNTTRVKSASIKSYNFVTPGREGGVPILDNVSPRPLVHTERTVLSSSRSRRNYNAPAVSEYQYSIDGKRQTSEGTSEDTDKMEVNFEALDLNSSADESIGDHMSVENRSEVSRVAPSETTNMTSVRRRKPRAYVSLTDPYRHARQSAKQQDQSKIGWPSYEDFRKMKQKIRNHNMGRKQPTEDKQSGNDVQKWVNIHYTRRKSRTSHSPAPSLPKLDPIIVPSHTCVDCPMCDMAARTDRSPTSCPPNSPAFDVSKSSPYVPSPHQCHSDSKMFVKDNMAARTAQNRNEMAIPKVTVKILDTKQQLEEARLSYSKFPN